VGETEASASHFLREPETYELAPIRPSGTFPRGRGKGRVAGTGEYFPKKSPASRGFFSYITFGSLKASGSPAKASTGMQLQNTFLSPCTLSTRATGGQYFCSFRLGSGNAASSRG